MIPYTSCKECGQKFPITNDTKVEGHSVWECSRCGHPHGESDIVVEKLKTWMIECIYWLYPDVKTGNCTEIVNRIDKVHWDHSGVKGFKAGWDHCLDTTELNITGEIKAHRS